MLVVPSEARVVGLGGLDHGWGLGFSRDFFAIVRSTDRGSMKWMDGSAGIRFDLAIVISADALTAPYVPVRAHVSHSTLLVSCRLFSFTFLFSLFPEIIRRRGESRARRKFGLGVVGWWRTRQPG